MFSKKLIQKLSNIIQHVPLRKFSSALYVTDDKAQKTFALLTPVIDFEEQLQNEKNLQNNISSRCLNINLTKLIDNWKFFQIINDKKNSLEQTKSEIGLLITDLLKSSTDNQDDIEKLKLHLKIIKEDLKTVKTFYYSVEENTMLSILNLPNVLHKRTPLHQEKIIHTFLDKTKGTSKHHMEIGTDKKYINYIDAYTCFLKSEAALFEINLLNYFKKCLEDYQFLQFVSPNFCRTIIVEGCGEEPSSLICVEEEESISKVNQLHLCGGSSLFSFMAYFARHMVRPNVLPIKCFSVGKLYQPLSKKNDTSLFYLSQQSVVSIFVATSEEEVYLDSLIEKVTTIYQELGCHFRLSLLPASQLKRAESLHISIQMFSNFLGEYVEVGNISVYENFLSKRLLFTYADKKERMFPKVISGTLVNVPKVLGCLLENQSLSGHSLLCNSIKNVYE